MAPLTPLEALVIQAYEESMMIRLRESHPGGRNIDVHAATVIGWMFGMRELGHTSYTDSLYIRHGTRPFKIDVYRNQHKLIQQQITELRNRATEEFRAFFETHPIMEKGEQVFYGGDGRKYYQRGPHFETNIDGAMVRVYKDEAKGGGYCYRKADGQSEYLTAQINNAIRACEELLKRISLIGPSTEFGPFQANEAGLLTDDLTEFKPHASQIAASYFLPNVTIAGPWQSPSEEGAISLMSEENVGILASPNPHNESLIFNALRSSNPDERIAGIHAFYLSYICNPTFYNNLLVANPNLQKLIFGLGYSLLSDDQKR